MLPVWQARSSRVTIPHTAARRQLVAASRSISRRQSRPVKNPTPASSVTTPMTAASGLSVLPSTSATPCTTASGSHVFTVVSVCLSPCCARFGCSKTQPILANGRWKLGRFVAFAVSQNALHSGRAILHYCCCTGRGHKPPAY